LVLNKTAAVCVFCDMGRGGKGRMPDASCKSGQALEKAQNGNEQLLEKVGMDLGLAPRAFGDERRRLGGLAWRIEEPKACSAARGPAVDGRPQRFGC